VTRLERWIARACHAAYAQGVEDAMMELRDELYYTRQDCDESGGQLDAICEMCREAFPDEEDPPRWAPGWVRLLIDRLQGEV